MRLSVKILHPSDKMLPKYLYKVITSLTHKVTSKQDKYDLEPRQQLVYTVKIASEFKKVQLSFCYSRFEASLPHSSCVYFCYWSVFYEKGFSVHSLFYLIR